MSGFCKAIVLFLGMLGIVYKPTPQIHYTSCCRNADERCYLIEGDPASRDFSCVDKIYNQCKIDCVELDKRDSGRPEEFQTKPNEKCSVYEFQDHIDQYNLKDCTDKCTMAKVNGPDCYRTRGQ